MRVATVIRTARGRVLLSAVVMINSVETAFADGKVFARPEVEAKVEIPNQQALIHHRGGLECLVIETTFLGEGTNFAWVVPLPAVPKVHPVSENFFPALRQTFQPRLVHYIYHYYLGVLFLCGLAFLGWRSFKDEVVWVTDLPLCLLLATGIGMMGKSFLLGSLTLAFTIGTRLLIRSAASFTLVLLLALMLTFWVATGLELLRLGYVDTLGSGGLSREVVDVLSVQRAGVFEATTIRSEKPRAILEWLKNNGFAAPKSVEPAVRDYVERGWVFVASKVRRASPAGGIASLHPLAFTFATATPVYPLKLTGVDNGDCMVDLYVFGDRRAAASHFAIGRCDRVANNAPDEPAKRRNSWLRINDAEVMNCVGSARVGTKLSARLTPKQMDSDAEITWRRFSTKASVVYSHAGATTIALNIGVPLAVFGWLLVGASRGGWKVDERFVARWRWRMILVALIFGGAIYWLLPKVETVSQLLRRDTAGRRQVLCRSLDSTTTRAGCGYNLVQNWHHITASR